MDQDADRRISGQDMDKGKECPVCEQEHFETCPINSSDCPFAYDKVDADPDPIAKDKIPEELADFGLDDDLLTDDEDEDDDVSLDPFADND